MEDNIRSSFLYISQRENRETFIRTQNWTLSSNFSLNSLAIKYRQIVIEMIEFLIRVILAILDGFQCSMKFQKLLYDSFQTDSISKLTCDLNESERHMISIRIRHSAFVNLSLNSAHGNIIEWRFWIRNGWSTQSGLENYSDLLINFSQTKNMSFST